MLDHYSYYISGSISKRGVEEASKHFKKVQEFLESRGKYCYNPIEFPERDTWEDYMRDGLASLVDSDAIVMLDGWQESRGASLERIVAFELNIPIIYEHQLWASSEN